SSTKKRKSDSDTEDDKAKASPPPSKAIATIGQQQPPASSGAQLRLTYYPAYLPSKLAGRLFRLPRTPGDLLWVGHCQGVRVRPNGTQCLGQLCAYGDAGVAYTYSGTRVPAKPWLPSLAAIRDVLAADAKLGHVRFNFALVNRYATGDNYIGEHRDSEPDLDPSAPIVKPVSGRPAGFLFPSAEDGREGAAGAGRGSLLAMHPPTNSHWLPLPAQAEKRVQQPRINITFRRIIELLISSINCQPNICVAMDAVKSAIARIPEAPEPLGEEFYAKHIKGGTLRDYQVFGADWLGAKFSSGHGAILADEMGLGKTLQTVAFLLGLHGGRRRGGVSGRSVIVCPLSVLNNWRDELAKFAPQLTVRVYTGDKAERERLRTELRREDWTLLLSTYELCLKDEEFFAKFSFDAMVVDEGHRLKNSNSQLHLARCGPCRFILTGTPIQNNLDELFTLLSFVAPKVFRLKLKDQFIAEVTDLVSSNDNSGALYEILKPFLLRRIKEDVLKSLPKKKLRSFCITDLPLWQKKYYKAILTKNIGNT
uniref:Helicase ATP-binding domain-containing protein n=1 Tax=Macrostomum lignano TaxID=282301 RepID=A0A1I8FAS7_9PLAT